MDGYVKNKTEAIRSARVAIFWHYAITFPILLFIPVWLFGIYGRGSPDDWKSSEIVYSHFSYETIGLQRGTSDVLNTMDGQKYVVQRKLVSADSLKERLVPGEIYTLVYSDTIAGGDHMEALYNEDEQFLELSVSIAVWEEERQECSLALCITIGLEMIALILIDRLWCKEEYVRIQKMRQDIEKRKAKLIVRNSK